MKHSKLYLTLGLATILTAGCGGGGGGGSSTSSTITSTDIPQLTEAVTDSLESALDPSAPASPLKTSGTQANSISNILLKQTQQILQAPVTYEGFCDSGSLTMDIDVTPYVFTYSNCVYTYGTTTSTINGTFTYEFSDANNGTYSITYNNVYYSYVDTAYSISESSTISGSLTCINTNTTIDCTDNLTVSSSSFSSEGGTYTNSDVVVTENNDGTYDIELTLDAPEIGALNIFADNIEIGTCGSEELIIGGTITITAEDGTYFTITFGGCDTFTVTFNGTAETYNWADIM